MRGWFSETCFDLLQTGMGVDEDFSPWKRLYGISDGS